MLAYTLSTCTHVRLGSFCFGITYMSVEEVKLDANAPPTCNDTIRQIN